MKDVKKTPWPTKDAMEQVYNNKLWGGKDVDFYSGEGSHNSEIVERFIDALTQFLSTIEKPLVVCDLGCGDFNVGRRLVNLAENYIAVDIVSDLIARNKQNFKTENLEFLCLDIAKDDLPAGDCAIVRQVLQHLSNAEIQNILVKLTNYKYVILTEHLPSGDFIPNVDIISGQGTRLKKQSGVDILVSPFDFKPLKSTLLSSILLKDRKGEIRTTIYKMF